MKYSLDNVLTAADALELEEKEIFLDIFSKRISEEKRRELLNDANETFYAIELGIAKKGDLKDLEKLLQEN